MASNKIKGITIEIDGDTTKLGKALDGAEQSSRSLQGELKGVETLLKLDPSNVELLTQKQQILTNAIGSTKEKLETLRSAQAQVQAQFERGDITVEQYRDFQREIIVTEKRLEKLQETAKEFGSVFQQQVQVASEKTKELGTKVEEAGKKMSGVSAVATAGLVASAKSAVDNETAVNKYIASTGKATSETEKYKNMMETIYQNNYGESIADVADKMRIVSNIMGDLPDEELQNVVEKSYMLQDAYDMDFQENIRGVNALMDQFGITSEQAYELINQGAQKGLNQNQDLTDQIAEYSTYYAKLGFTAEDFFNMMIAGAEDGAYQIDYLNDAMKEFGIRTKDNSKSTNDAYETLGLNVEEVNNKFAQGGDKAQEAFAEVTKAIMSIEDPVKRNEVGVALFGTKFEDLEESAVFAMTSAKDQVDMLGDTVENTTDTMYKGTGAKAKEAVRSIQTSFASLGESLLPILAPIAEKIAELAKKFSQLSPTVQKVILIITGLASAFGPVVIVIGKIISAVGTILPLLAKLAPIFTNIMSVVKLLFGVIMANPVVAVITAIIAGIVLLWNKCEWFRDLVTGLFNGLISVFNIVVDFFKNNWQTILLFILNPFAGVFKLLYEKFEGFRNFVDGFVQKIKDIFFSIIDFFKNNWQGILLFIVNPFAGAFKLLYDNFEGFRNFVNNIIEAIKKFFTNLWNNVKTGAQNGLNALKNIWSSVGNWFNSKIIQPVTNLFSGLWNKLKSGASNAWSGIKSVFSSTASWFGNTFQKAWTAVKNVFSTGGRIFTGIKDGIVSAFTSVVNGIIGGINRVVSIPFNAINGALNKIRNVSIMGLSPFSGLPTISVPQIPRLATGDVAKPNNPYIAMLGDNKKEEEVISPLSTMKEAMMDALTSFTNTRYQNGTSSNVGELTRLLKQYMPQIIENMGQEIILDDKTLVGKIAPRVDKQLGIMVAKKSRGY